MQVYLDNCAFKIANKQMTYYLDNNIFETDETDLINAVLNDDRIYISEGIDSTQSNRSKESMICHYWFLIMDSDFKIL